MLPDVNQIDLFRILDMLNKEGDVYSPSFDVYKVA
jgi:hypothetical protein